MSDFMTQDEVIELFGQRARKNKYHAIRTEYAGAMYDSTAEANRAADLDLLYRAGEIAFWSRQPVFHLGCPENKYVADFLVVTQPYHVHVEDVKGFQTMMFRRNARLWKRYGPYDLHVIAKGKPTKVIPAGMPVIIS